MEKFIPLKHRSIIEISGKDRTKFLQGLITNDSNKISEDHLIYSAMLNAQGRFLYDFFLFENDEKIFIDCPANRRDEIAKKFKMYKLRNEINVGINDSLQIFHNFSSQKPQNITLTFSDPRSPKLGFRSYAKIDEIPAEQIDEAAINQYHFLRISNKIPEGELDLTYEKSFILEFRFNEMNAVDYDKGCYVGQELTARTHHLGEIRKELLHLIFDERTILEKGEKIPDDKEIDGKILSSVFYQNKLHVLAIAKING